MTVSTARHADSVETTFRTLFSKDGTTLLVTKKVTTIPRDANGYLITDEAYEHEEALPDLSPEAAARLIAELATSLAFMSTPEFHQ